MQPSVAVQTCIPAYVRQLALLLICMLIVSACGKMEYGTREENFNRETRKGDRLAFVNFDRGEGTNPYPINFNRDKLHRGYAIQAPLHRTGDVTPLHLTVSRTKEYRWFGGLQLSFNF